MIKVFRLVTCSMDNWSRRAVLSGTAVAISSVAGCLGGSGENATPAPDGVAPSAAPRPSRGPEDASVTVELYTDYECPHCHDFHSGTEQQLVDEFVRSSSDPNVQFQFYDYPIPVGNNSWLAAMAGVTAGVEAGASAHVSYRDQMFESQNASTDLIRTTLEETAGVSDSVWEDVQNQYYRKPVEADKERGNSHGISGTPGVVVNGTVVSPPEGDRTYQDAIRAEIQSQL
ncbi:thioredoxin domain-containing protein [Halorientalis persicus]